MNFYIANYLFKNYIVGGKICVTTLVDKKKEKKKESWTQYQKHNNSCMRSKNIRIKYISSKLKIIDISNSNLRRNIENK
jgi:hypothetical protein